MRLTQDAQVIPSIGRVSSEVVSAARSYSLGVYHPPLCARLRGDRSRRDPCLDPRSVGPVLPRRDAARDRRDLWLTTADAFEADLARRLGAPIAPGRRGRPGRPSPRDPGRGRGRPRGPPGGRPAGPPVPFDLADRPAWDRHVLEAVAGVPWGSTVSYGEIARRVGAPRAARAVGGAVGRNPIGLLIPCHRVIAADGTIGGYGGDAWGSREDRLEIKRCVARAKVSRSREDDSAGQSRERRDRRSASQSLSRTRERGPSLARPRPPGRRPRRDGGRRREPSCPVRPRVRQMRLRL